MAKAGFRLYLVVAVLFAAAGAAAAFMINGFNFEIPFLRKTEISASSAVLTEVRDVCRLNTVEFVYKTVFPYDLLPEDIDEQALLDKLKTGKVLNSRELQYLAVYGIAKDAGMDLSQRSGRFVVITARVKAGYDLSDNRFPALHIDGRSITAVMPEPVITEVIIEDENSQSYPYPDMGISPDQWKKLSSLMASKAAKEAEARGIPEKAGIRGTEMVKRLLKGAGFESIEFADQLPSSPSDSM